MDRELSRESRWLLTIEGEFDSRTVRQNHALTFEPVSVIMNGLIEEFDMSLIDLIDESLLTQADRYDPYAESVFLPLRRLTPKAKGKVYEQIVEDVVSKLGQDVQRPKSTQYDRLIDGMRVEIKGATLTGTGGKFNFLQIRPDQDYDVLLFAMFYPDDLVLMTMNKERVVELCNDGTFGKQHGGKAAESRTFAYGGNRETLAALGAKVIG